MVRKWLLLGFGAEGYAEPAAAEWPPKSKMNEIEIKEEKSFEDATTGRGWGLNLKVKTDETVSTTFNTC